MILLSGGSLLTVLPKVLKQCYFTMAIYIRQFHLLFVEYYENVKQLLIKINYAQFKWYVCGDFKMLGVFLALQRGYTKYSCFLCLWNSKADSEHYEKMHWPTREELTPGMYNVIRKPLVSREKVLLPPLHIKLGLVKQFVKALGFEGEVFQEIRSMFFRLSDAKIKGGISLVPR